MPARLYTIELSPPGHAARLMLERKGIDHRVTVLPVGLHPALVRALGFRGGTVPVLRIDGRRIETSLAIARELERVRPEPALYPADAAERARVEQAERWGEAELQPVPRRILRWALTGQPEARRWIAKLARLPAPGLQAMVALPLVRHFARASGATEEAVRGDLRALPEKLDRVDALIGEGTVSVEHLSAASFQVGTAVRALTLFPQLEPLVADRPAGRLARALLPDFPQAPVVLPAAWVPS